MRKYLIILIVGFTCSCITIRKRKIENIHAKDFELSNPTKRIEFDTSNIILKGVFMAESKNPYPYRGAIKFYPNGRVFCSWGNTDSSLSLNPLDTSIKKGRLGYYTKYDTNKIKLELFRPGGYFLYFHCSYTDSTFTINRYRGKLDFLFTKADKNLYRFYKD